MFEDPTEVEPGSYQTGSSSSVQLAAGKQGSRCLGSGVLKVGDINEKVEPFRHWLGSQRLVIRLRAIM